MPKNGKPRLLIAERDGPEDADAEPPLRERDALAVTETGQVSYRVIRSAR